MSLAVDVFFYLLLWGRSAFNHRSKIELHKSNFYIYQKGTGEISDLQTVNTSTED